MKREKTIKSPKVLKNLKNMRFIERRIVAETGEIRDYYFHGVICTFGNARTGKELTTSIGLVRNLAGVMLASGIGLQRPETTADT
jgi:hypothetical protein